MSSMGNDRSRLGRALRERGLRPTKARLALLQVLDGRADHPTAEQLLQELRRAGHTLGTATVYQNLTRLAAEGLLDRFTGPDGLMRFETNLEPHHHLVCERCGQVLDADVDMAELDRLRPVHLRTRRPVKGWELHSMRLEIHGLCPSCS